MTLVWLLALAAATPPSVVRVQAEDPVLRGALIHSLLAEGQGVATDDTSHDIVVTTTDGEVRVTCTGAGSHTATIPPGPPALVELELRHRVSSLLRETPGRAHDAGDDAFVALSVIDHAPVELRLAERVAAALLTRGLRLGQGGDAVARLCITVDDRQALLGWIAGPLPCTAASPTTLALAPGAPDAIAQSIADEALRLRSAADETAANARAQADEPGEPAQEEGREDRGGETQGMHAAIDVTEGGDAPLLEPAGHPFLLTVHGGGLLRTGGVDPLLDAQLLWRSWGDSVGPMLMANVSGSVATQLSVVEGMLAAGIGGGWDFGERVRLTAGLAGGVWLHGYLDLFANTGLLPEPVIVAPITLQLRLTPALALSAGLQTGLVRQTYTHLTSLDEELWGRTPYFAAVLAGVTYSFGDGFGSGG